MNSLLSKISSCPKESVDSYITEALALSNFNLSSNEVLGYVDNKGIYFIHDFIPLSSRFKYCLDSSNSYSLTTTDYFYDFANYIKDKNISNIDSFVKEVYSFLNNYFGGLNSGDDRRNEYFDNIAFQMSSTDQEYYDYLDKICIGDFKGKSIAMSSERSIVAQNLMSLFGIDSYLCVGMIDFLENKREHCFNIIDNGRCFSLIDYSIPCYTIVSDKVVDSNPFIGQMSSEELEVFLNDNHIESFKDYVNVFNEGEYLKMPTGSSRSYSLCNKKMFMSNNQELS